MIRRLRSALGNPLVVAYTALTLALFGGTAAYAVATIGSEDIIDGSILSKDIKNGGVKGIDVGNNSLTGQDIDESSFSTGPRKFDIDVPVSPQGANTWVPMLTLGNATLYQRCYYTVIAGPVDGIAVSSTDPGTFNATYTADALSSGGGPVPLQSGSILNAGETVEVLANAGGFEVTRSEGQILIEAGSQVTTVAFHAVVNGNSTRCQFVGTAIAATS